VSVRCTHMGCMLQWNGAETSWDCPCHGSRFDPDGRVLDAPAIKPLDRVDLDDDQP
jgi:Rieske Fe-S protein